MVKIDIYSFFYFNVSRETIFFYPQKKLVNIIKFFLAGILGLRKKHSAVTMSAKEIHVEVEESLTWCVDGEEGPSVNFDQVLLVSA